MTAISVCSGHHGFNITAGIAYRSINDAPTNSGNDAASRCRHPKLIKYYTDLHDVDENESTISAHGGHWNYTSGVGIVNRHVLDSPSYTHDDVASRNISFILLFSNDVL